MMKQYYSIKREHPDALLMFRMGDFYETFGEDARTVSRELDIVLTARDRKSKNPVPLAGIPYHALDSYLAKLIRRGYRVAICDQLEDPKAARGLVKRGVTRVVSPGTVVEGALLDASHNFLAAVLESDGRYGLALLDISTGDFRAAQFARRSGLEAELVRHAPAEVLVTPAGEAEDGLAEWLRAHGFAVTEAELEGWLHPVAAKALEKRFGALELEPLAMTAGGAVLREIAAARVALEQALGMRESLDEDSLCPRGRASQRARYLRNLLDSVYGQEVQPYLADLDRRQRRLGERLRALRAASSGRCSQICSPGVRVEIGANSPRMFSVAFGLGSKLSC